MGSLEDILINWRSALMFALCFPMLITALMLFSRRVERRANAFLAALLIAVVLVQIPQIIGFSGFYNIWPSLTFLPVETTLYLGPLLYLHAWTLINDKPLNWRWALLIPGAVQTAYYTAAFFALGDYENKWEFTRKIHDPYILPIETLLAVGLVLFVLYKVGRNIKTYEGFLTDTHSAKMEYDPIWLRRLIRSLWIGGVIFIAIEFLELIHGGLSYEAEFPIQMIMTGIIAWLGLEALSRTSRPFPKIYVQQLKAEIEGKKSERDWATDGQTLKAAIEAGNWHLSPVLSLRDLARRMGSNETYMSRTINLGLDTNFNRLINTMRVEHAKNLLKETDSNILEIALDSGFNSKPTFNRVFRDLSGQTPTQYRNKAAEVK